MAQQDDPVLTKLNRELAELERYLKEVEFMDFTRGMSKARRAVVLPQVKADIKAKNNEIIEYKKRK